MNFTGMLCTIPAAAYGLVNLALSIVLAVAWRARGDRASWTADELLAWRLLPAGAAALVAVTVVLPAFLIYEPNREHEPAGPLFLGLALVAAVAAGAGVARAWRACAGARALLRSCGAVGREAPTADRRIDIVDVAEPIVAVVGGWRPRILAAKGVRDACSDKEFRQVIEHEAAHVATGDNLKLLLLTASPDVLAWLPGSAAITTRWRAAAEGEADERATGADPRKRVALAAALIKVARLAGESHGPSTALSMPVAMDDVDARVRRLLSPPAAVTRKPLIRRFLIGAALIPVMACPFYPLVHRCIEAVVAFGR